MLGNCTGDPESYSLHPSDPKAQRIGKEKTQTLVGRRVIQKVMELELGTMERMPASFLGGKLSSGSW